MDSNFISRINLYDDRITIVYNTSLNPTEEIYNKRDNAPNNNDNNSGTTIYKTELNLENMQEKSRSNPDEFKRLLNGETDTNTCVISRYNQNLVLMVKKTDVRHSRLNNILNNYMKILKSI